MAHLLLIDDDPALIPDQVRQACPAPAHTVAVACTGAEGLERVQARPPDVILLDLRLPDQSGLEFYQQVRQVDACIPGRRPDGCASRPCSPRPRPTRTRTAPSSAPARPCAWGRTSAGGSGPTRA